MTVLPKCGIRRYLLYDALILIAYLQICHCVNQAVIWKPICKTPECKNLADYYKRIMNPNVSPCDDFYDYVCHGWGKENPRPKSSNSWGVHNVLEAKTMVDIKQLVEKKEGTDDTPDEANVKSLYRACMRLPTLERIPMAKLKNITTTVGNWPMSLPGMQKPQYIPWQKVHNEYIKISGESPLFTYFLHPETRNNRFIIRLKAQGIYSPYGMLKRKTNWDEVVEVVHYKAFLIKLVKALAGVDSEEYSRVIKNNVHDIVNFREKLRNAAIATEEAPFETLSIGEFQNRYDSTTKANEIAKIDWLAVFRSTVKDSKDVYGVPIERTTLIYVQPLYFTKLSAILANTDNRVIGNHIHLYFAERHVQFTQDIESDLENSVSQGGNETGRVRYQLERWEYCLGNPEIQTTLGRMYLKSYFPSSTKSAVTDMISLANATLYKQITESMWVKPELRKAWLQMLDHLDAEVGYPSWYFDKFGGSRATPADVNPIKVNAHYSVNHNRIGISAAYLQWPVYDAKLPFAVQYGALLPTIGHELYHTLNYNDFRENTLSLQDSKKRQEMIGEYLKRSKCFMDHYSNFKKKIKKPKWSKNSGFPLTINEDIPDVMGLKLAYRTYREKLRLSDGHCHILQEFPDFTCDKLFFIAFATTTCSDSNPNWEMNVLLTDEHNPSSVRVNGAVANMKEFADAFNCKDGHNLVRKNTCDLWK